MATTTCLHTSVRYILRCSRLLHLRSAKLHAESILPAPPPQSSILPSSSQDIHRDHMTVDWIRMVIDPRVRESTFSVSLILLPFQPALPSKLEFAYETEEKR
ncbi:hypothetical protein L2E82_30839 [Cichorium intybus]|uniref:Uncharacterized protein n=1 Tax=Cichorium intybus TaxID=13427 RepID=A0ACB9D1P1_CICIN|nr:hypothetical protein L2E82_30839 [Cichorium intybus]